MTSEEMKEFELDKKFVSGRLVEMQRMFTEIIKNVNAESDYEKFRQMSITLAGIDGQFIFLQALYGVDESIALPTDGPNE